MKNVPLLTISQLMQIGDEIWALLCSDDPIQILLKLAWIVTFTILAYYRKLCMESWEHGGAYISSPIFINRLFLARGNHLLLSGYTSQSQNFTNSDL